MDKRESSRLMHNGYVSWFPTDHSGWYVVATAEEVRIDEALNTNKTEPVEYGKKDKE